MLIDPIERKVHIVSSDTAPEVLTIPKKFPANHCLKDLFWRSIYLGLETLYEFFTRHQN